VALAQPFRNEDVKRFAARFVAGVTEDARRAWVPEANDADGRSGIGLRLVDMDILS
jgi:hypothetical protein